MYNYKQAIKDAKCEIFVLAQELIDFGNSKEKAEGYGLMSSILLIEKYEKKTE